MSEPACEIIERLKKQPEIHPVQTRAPIHGGAKLSSRVTLAAYEVYAEVHSHQAAMIDLPGRGCRGGFAAGEIIAFLYARSFPKDQWAVRIAEAFAGMEQL